MLKKKTEPQAFLSGIGRGKSRRRSDQKQTEERGTTPTSKTGRTTAEPSFGFKEGGGAQFAPPTGQKARAREKFRVGKGYVGNHLERLFLTGALYAPLRRTRREIKVSRGRALNWGNRIWGGRPF